MKFVAIEVESRRTGLWPMWWIEEYKDGYWSEYPQGCGIETFRMDKIPSHLADKNKFRISKSFRRIIEEEKTIQKLR